MGFHFPLDQSNPAQHGFPWHLSPTLSRIARTSRLDAPSSTPPHAYVSAYAAGAATTTTSARQPVVADTRPAPWHSPHDPRVVALRTDSELRLTLTGTLDDIGLRRLICECAQHDVGTPISATIVLHGLSFGSEERAAINIVQFIKFCARANRPLSLDLQYPVPQPRRLAVARTDGAPAEQLRLLYDWALHLSLLVHSLPTALRELQQEFASRPNAWAQGRYRDGLQNCLKVFTELAQTTAEQAAAVAATVMTGNDHGDDVLNASVLHFELFRQVLAALTRAANGSMEAFRTCITPRALRTLPRRIEASFAHFAPMRRQRVPNTDPTVQFTVDNSLDQPLQFAAHRNVSPSMQLTMLQVILGELVIGNAAAFAKSQIWLRTARDEDGMLHLTVENDLPVSVDAADMAQLGRIGVGLPGLTRADSNRLGLAAVNRLLRVMDLPPLAVSVTPQQTIAFTIAIPGTRLI